MASLFLVAAVGCGRPGDGRVVVHGTVNYAGNPVAAGVIRFQPTGKSVGPVSVTTIADGRYHLDALGGVIAGTHRVEIRGFPPSETPPSGPGPQRQQLLPAKYNTKTELEVTLTPDERQRELNFDLQP